MPAIRSSAVVAISMIPALWLATAGPAAGQQQSGLLEEIVVTAQKREQGVQSVPIAINAYGGERLVKSGVENTLDLQFVEPSLVFTTNAAFGQPYLRGVGTDLFTPGAESSIATFVDDIYQSRTSSSFQNLFDVDRLEVVKGPQGVLFGRNAVGGAINIYNRQPGSEAEGYLTLAVGNFSKLRAEGAVNVPLNDGRTAFRASALSAVRDGFTRNLFDGGDVDDEEFVAFRAQLKHEFSDSVEALFSASVGKENSSRSLAARVNPDAGLAIADFFGAARPPGAFNVSVNENSKVLLDTFGVSADIAADLGWSQLRSITAYRESDLDIVLDLDASQLDFASNMPRQKSETFSQEFQLISTTGEALEWVAGLYYLSEDAEQRLNVALDFPAVTGAPSDFLDSPGGSVDTTSFGLFGNLSYALSDAWKVSVGARYNYDERDLEFLETLSVLSTGQTFLSIPLTLDDDYSEVTPRLVVEYTPNTNILAYGSISRGYKAGGFNTNVFQPEGFEPETLWAYELGLKTTLLDGRGRLNVALFNYDYEDLQLNTIPPGSPVGTFQIVINAAEASIQGLEADFALAVSDALQLNLGLALLDAEFDRFVALNPNSPGDGEQDRSGGALPRAPETSFNLGAEYTFDVAGRPLSLRADLRYESDQFLDVFQDEAVRRDSNSVVNAQLTYDHTDQLSLALWGRNLTDEEIVQSSLRVDGLFGTIQFFAPPRTYGASATYRF